MNATAQTEDAGNSAAPNWFRAHGWTWLAFGCFFAGILCRMAFILYWNRPNDPSNFFSDMNAYLVAARRFCNPQYVPNITDTIFPPGGGIYFGLMMKFDPTLDFAARMQFFLACVVPLLMLGIGRRLFGPRFGLFAMAFSSLYFPLFEYFGFLLTEGPFLFCMLLSYYLLCLSLTSRTSWVSWAAGGGAGTMLGLASAFKSIALVSAVLIFAALLLMRRRCSFRLMPLLASSVAGLLAVLIPLSIRATRLNEGKFLLIANEAHRSFLLGHQGRIGNAQWTDRKRGYFHEFGCPVAAQKGYKETVKIEVGVYEGEEQYRLAWTWISNHPAEAALQSTEHAFDLFTGSVPWPGSVMPYQSWVIFFEEVFLVLVLIPGFIHMWNHRRGFFRFEQAYWGDWLALLPVISVFLVAFLFVGEPRYRIPYDAFMILFAARAFCGVRSGDPAFLRPEGSLEGAPRVG